MLIKGKKSLQALGTEVSASLQRAGCGCGARRRGAGEQHSGQERGRVVSHGFVPPVTPAIRALPHLLWPPKGRDRARPRLAPRRPGHLASPHPPPLGWPLKILTSYGLPLAVPRDYPKQGLLEGQGPTTPGQLHQHVLFPKIYLANYFLNVSCVPTAPSAQVTAQQTRQGC